MDNLRRLFGRLFLATTVLIAACSPPEPAVDRGPDPPVVIISVDTLRADRLPVYGYTNVQTPHIDALARDSILFRSAWSPCPITLPAHLSMLTGLLPPEHGVRANAGYRFDATANRSLPLLLKASGYETGASVSSWILRADTGMGGMFDQYDDAIVLGSRNEVGENQRRGDVAAAYGSKWIADRAGRPFFFLLHLYEPHAPYDPPEPFRSQYAHAYDGEVAATDAIVGRFLDQIRRSGVYDRAMIVFTSDHGEGLMDHGEDQHGILIYREAIQVPLLIKLPRSERAGEVVDAPAQLSDLPRTILGRVTGAANPELPGTDLLARAVAPPRRIYSETFYPRIHLGWSELRSLTDGIYHYIEAPRPELYDLRKDPGERVNILADERRVASAMRTELAAIPKKLEKLGEVDEELAARLRSLGYLASPAIATGPLPNPNEQVRHLTELKRGFLLAEEGRWQAAATALRPVVQSNPAMLEASLKLGEALTELGQHKDAIATYEEAMRRTPRFSPDLALALATTHLRAGALEDAASAARLALDQEAGRSHELLARIALAGRRWDDAERHARAAAGTDQPRLMLVEAEVAIARGQYERALAQLDRAEARNRDLGGGALFRLNHLRGDAYARTNRIEESQAAYRREIEAFPRHLQAWGNLAVIYFVTGREKEFGALLDEMVRRNPTPGARAFAARIVESVKER